MMEVPAGDQQGNEIRVSVRGEELVGKTGEEGYREAASGCHRLLEDSNVTSPAARSTLEKCSNRDGAMKRPFGMQDQCEGWL